MNFPLLGYTTFYQSTCRLMDIHISSTNNFAMNICVQVLYGCFHFSWGELLGHMETDLPFEKLLDY